MRWLVAILFVYAALSTYALSREAADITDLRGHLAAVEVRDEVRLDRIQNESIPWLSDQVDRLWKAR